MASYSSDWLNRMSPNFSPWAGSIAQGKPSPLWATYSFCCASATACHTQSAQRETLVSHIFLDIWEQSHLGQRTIDMTDQKVSPGRLRAWSCCSTMEQKTLASTGTALQSCSGHRPLGYVKGRRTGVSPVTLPWAIVRRLDLASGHIHSELNRMMAVSSLALCFTWPWPDSLVYPICFLAKLFLQTCWLYESDWRMFPKLTQASQIHISRRWRDPIHHNLFVNWKASIFKWWTWSCSLSILKGCHLAFLVKCKKLIRGT